MNPGESLASFSPPYPRAGEFSKEPTRVKAYSLQGKRKRQIAREHNRGRKTVEKAIDNRPPQPYRLSKPKPALICGAYRARVDELLAENAYLPPRQQDTGHQIFELLQAEGSQGSEARVRLHVTRWNKSHRAPKLFLPLEFEPGQDAQVDWGRRVGAEEIVRREVAEGIARHESTILIEPAVPSAVLSEEKKPSDRESRSHKAGIKTVRGRCICQHQDGKRRE